MLSPGRKSKPAMDKSMAGLFSEFCAYRLINGKKDWKFFLTLSA
jgi:hypothetical protein